MDKKQDYINHDETTLLKSISNFKKDLSNKKIITFCTSGSSKLSPSTEDLKKTFPNANIENGKRL